MYFTRLGGMAPGGWFCEDCMANCIGSRRIWQTDQWKHPAMNKIGESELWSACVGKKWMLTKSMLEQSSDTRNFKENQKNITMKRDAITLAAIETLTEVIYNCYGRLKKPGFHDMEIRRQVNAVWLSNKAIELMSCEEYWRIGYFKPFGVFLCTVYRLMYTEGK